MVEMSIGREMETSKLIKLRNYNYRLGKPVCKLNIYCFKIYAHGTTIIFIVIPTQVMVSYNKILGKNANS